MDEEKEEIKEEKTVEEQTTEDTGEGDNPEEPEIIKRTNEAAKRLEEANKVAAEERRKREELIAREELSGRSAGGKPKEKPKEPTPQEYAEKLQRGEVNPLKEDGLI